MNSCRFLARVAAAGWLMASWLPASALAQQPAPPPPAAPEDVRSLDAIVTALYDVISGGKGQPRNWDRFRSLFVPAARLIPTGVSREGVVRHSMMTPEEYVTRVGPVLERDGFFEREIHRETDTFGNITQLFSTYESRRERNDPEPFARGINSIQLLNDGQRWWVVTIFWDAERPGNEIPSRYLP